VRENDDVAERNDREGFVNFQRWTPVGWRGWRGWKGWRGNPFLPFLPVLPILPFRST
jgi:hypothetical protein